MNITERQAAYAEAVKETLAKQGFRADFGFAKRENFL